MINSSELLDLQLRAEFGSDMPDHIKLLVNRELDAGIWLDGYEIAVTKKRLSQRDASKLLDLVMQASPKDVVDIKALSLIIREKLPQSAVADLSWIILPNNLFVVTDSLRVAKFNKEKLIWCTPRISYDGIKLVEIKNGIVFGLSWFSGDSTVPDKPFRLKLKDGTLLLGDIVD